MIVECLGAVPKLDTDVVQRVLGFVFDSLNPAVTRDQEYKVTSNDLQFFWPLFNGHICYIFSFPFTLQPSTGYCVYTISNIMNLLLCYMGLLPIEELLTSCFLSNVITTVMLYLYDQAGALMIVGVLGTRATLAPKLVQNLILFVARTAQHDAFESVDLPWLRVSVMALISLVQVWI